MLDADGQYTGEFERSYDAPQKISANVSPASGQIAVEVFGNDDSYDRVIALPWDSLALLFSPSDYSGILSEDGDLLSTGFIDENTVFFVDRNPDDSRGFDYVVRRIAKSINGLMIAVRKVNNNEDNS